MSAPILADENHPLPPLENGERLDRATFHARYLDTPEDFRAELIGGVVHLHGRVTWMHGGATAKLCYALGTYDMVTPGVECLPRVTVLLDDETEAEPDLCLRLEREIGGTSWIDEDDFVAGPPECLIEVSDHDTEQIDKCDKFRAYEKGGVREYIIILIREARVLWFVRQDGWFVESAIPSDGILCPRSFPGLRLDTGAVFTRDLHRMHSVAESGADTPEHAAFVAELARRRAERSRV